MADFVIENASPGDADGIAAFQIAMARETENKILDPDVVGPAVQRVFTDPSKGFYLVARDGDSLAGCLMVTFEWSDWRNCDMWYIQSVYVRPEFRGRGMFTGLYQRVIKLARESGSTFVRLYVETENLKAQKTYERLGMKKMPYFMYDVKLSDEKNS